MKQPTSSVFRITTTKLLIGLCIAVLLYKGYNHFYPDIPGYCYSQKRFISDEEFIEISLRRILTNGVYFRPDIDGSDESVRNFTKHHPGCCVVHRHKVGSLPENNAFSDEWTAHVLMTFKPLEKTSPSEPDMYTSYIILNVCGGVLNVSGGA